MSAVAKRALGGIVVAALLPLTSCSLLSSFDGLGPLPDGAVLDTGGGDGATCAADLTSDPQNCGSCGHGCLGGKCNAGQCAPVVLASGGNYNDGLAVDATFVYFSTTSGNSTAIDKISKALTQTGTATQVVSGQNLMGVQGMAADGTYVYWAVKTTSGSIQRALPNGAGLTTIAGNQNNADWLAVVGGTVFWTNQVPNTVVSAPITGVNVTPTQLNLTGENGSTPAGIAADANNVYYATKTNGGGLAESVPVSGGAVTEVGSATYVGMTVDANNVYWTGGFANPIVSQNAKTGTPSTVKIIAAGGSLTCPLHLVSDGKNVYFLDRGTDTAGNVVNGKGALYRVPVDNTGPLPPPLVSGMTDPQAIAIDDTAVYWVHKGGSAIMKLAK